MEQNNINSENNNEVVAPNKKFNFSFPNLRAVKKFIPLFIILLVLVGLYFAKGLFIAAMVNGTPIYRHKVLSNLEKSQGSQVLDNLIIETLVAQEAKKDNITATQEELDAKISELEGQIEQDGLTLEQALSQQKVSMAELKRQMDLQIKLEKILNARVSIADEDIAQYIEANKDYLPKDVTGDELNNQVRESLKQQKMMQAYESWLTEAKQRAKINFFVTY